MSISQNGGNSLKPLLGGGAVIALIAGAIYGGWTLIQQRNLNNTTQALNLGGATPQDQAAAENTFGVFVAAVRRHAFDQALQSTSNTYPSPHSASALATVAQTKLGPLVTGGDLQYEPVHMSAHGQKLYLRAQMRAGGKNYGTVCTLAKTGDGWRISDVLPPIPSTTTIAAHPGAVGSSTAPGPATGGKH